MTIEIVNEKPSEATTKHVRERRPVDAWIAADGSVHGIFRRVDPDQALRLIGLVGEVRGHSFRVRADESDGQT